MHLHFLALVKHPTTMGYSKDQMWLYEAEWMSSKKHDKSFQIASSFESYEMFFKL